METLKNEDVQVTPGLTFTYRKADIQGLTDPVHTTAALGAAATTVTTAVRLIQTSPTASIAGQRFAVLRVCVQACVRMCVSADVVRPLLCFTTIRLVREEQALGIR